MAKTAGPDSVTVLQMVSGPAWAVMQPVDFKLSEPLRSNMYVGSPSSSTCRGAASQSGGANILFSTERPRTAHVPVASSPDS